MSRRYADYEERDYVRSRYDEPELEIRETRRPAATVLSDRRSEKPGRQPDFLREDYGKSHAGPLVIREREEESWRPPPRRRSNETMRSKHPADVEREIIIRERERDDDRRPPYPSSERGGREEEIVFRDRAKSQAPSKAPTRVREEIDINIRRDDDHRVRSPPAKSEYARSEAPPRSEYHERDIEEIRFRRGPGDRPPARNVEREEIDIDIRERRGREQEEIDIRIREQERRGREQEEIDIRIREQERRGREQEEIDIRIRERERPAPRQRSRSRGVLVGKKEEEWIIRRQRSPSPPPPPRDHEREEIIIRRRERSVTPEPPREPTPQPPSPPPPPEPIVRPPIIQEIIHHHRHIDHGIEPARQPTPPPPPPAPPSPPREDNLEIEIHRSGTRNGKHFDEDIIIEQDRQERPRSTRPPERQRSRSVATRRQRSPSPAPPPARRGYDDDVAAEAEYYMRRAASRGYPGEAYDGATKDWGLVDVPPGTERVRMDGKGGGSQEISWQRYNGDRRSKFQTGDRIYEGEFGAPNPRSPPPAPLPPPPQTTEEIRITERRITEGTQKGRTKDKMWTEVTKDLVIKEAIEEMGYEYEETEEFFYVIEYLRYVSLPTLIFTIPQATNIA
jgi:hypothetical protein